MMKCNGDVNCPNDAVVGYCKEHEETYGAEILSLREKLDAKWNWVRDGYPDIEYDNNNFGPVWVLCYDYHQKEDEKEFFVHWCLAYYWKDPKYPNAFEFNEADTQTPINNVVAWQYEYVPNAPPNPYWCGCCSSWQLGEHYCGEWLRPDECTCTPYHSNETGTIEERICEHCKSKDDEIPF
jgi:hypothetical protein